MILCVSAFRTIFLRMNSNFCHILDVKLKLEAWLRLARIDFAARKYKGRTRRSKTN